MSRLEALAPRWGEISALLDEVLALTGDEARARWLDGLDGDRVSLRDTLRALLASNAGVETAGFLETLPRLATIAGDEAGAGLRIGPYRLISELGHGGMGSVWLAERADGQFERRVALKLPRLAWGSATAARLAREREILASLEHPHIARLYDAGVDAGGRPFFAMELIDGQPIDAWCRERGTPMRDRLALLLQVCDAVAHAHSRLTIHRDLKPGNILVTAGGQVKLLDFGIAKLLEGEHTAETALTREAGRALTLDYASPEQIAGLPLGTASDVYSLGVVAYELLAVAKPYRLKRGSAAELEEAVATVDPPRASDAASDPALKKALRGDLDAILGKALRKSPAERYVSASALADDVRRHLGGFAVLAQPDSRIYLARKFVSRHRLPVAAAASVVLALAVGLGLALWQSQRAQLQARQAQRAADRETAVSRLYLETLTTAAGWDSATFAKPGSVPRLLVRTLDELEKKFRDSPDHRLAILESVAVNLPYMGEAEAALAVITRWEAALGQAAAPADQLLNARTYRAHTLIDVGRPVEAEAVLRSALAAPDAELSSRHTRGRAMSRLGSVLEHQGKHVQARQALKEAVALLDEPASVQPRAAALQVLASTYKGFDHAAALQAAEQAHAALLSDPKSERSYLGASFMFLGAALADIGRTSEAEAAMKKSLAAIEPLYGPTDVDTVKAVMRIAQAAAGQGRYDEARRLLAERRAMVEARSGPQRANAMLTLKTAQIETEWRQGDIAAAWRFATLADGPPAALAQQPLDEVVYVGRLLCSLGRGEQAIGLIAQRLRALQTQRFAKSGTFKLRTALAEAMWDTGRHEDARREWVDLVDTMTREQAINNWTYVQANEWAAVASSSTGRTAEALALLQALDGRTPAAGPASKAERAESAWRRATVFAAAGQRDRAATLLLSLQADLEGQHAGSPRLVALKALQAAMN